MRSFRYGLANRSVVIAQSIFACVTNFRFVWWLVFVGHLWLSVLVAEPAWAHVAKVAIAGETVVLEPPKNPEVLSVFQAMARADQELFLKTREEFLRGGAKTLSAFRYVLGTGSVLKQQATAVVNVGRKMVGREAKVSADLEELRSLSFEKRSVHMVTAVLRTIDEMLWSQAPVVAQRNEFGVFVSVGAAVAGGLNGRGWGRMPGLGISMGINVEKKKFITQVYADWEPVKSWCSPAIGLAAGYCKAGLYLESEEGGAGKEGTPPGEKGQLGKGKGLYSPAWVYTNGWENRAEMGAMLTLGIPLHLGFVNDVKRLPLLLFTASTEDSGFVRVRTGVSFPRIAHAVEYLKQLVFRRRGPLKCSALLPES